MFSLKNLVVLSIASVSLFAAAPAAQARPGPTNPFSHPVQAYSWDANRYVGGASERIKAVGAKAAFVIFNPGHKVMLVDETNTPSVLIAASMEISSLAQQYTNLINADAAILAQAFGESSGLRGMIENVRAGAAAEVRRVALFQQRAIEQAFAHWASTQGANPGDK